MPLLLLHLSWKVTLFVVAVPAALGLLSTDVAMLTNQIILYQPPCYLSHPEPRIPLLYPFTWWWECASHDSTTPNPPRPILQQNRDLLCRTLRHNDDRPRWPISTWNREKPSTSNQNEIISLIHNTLLSFWHLPTRVCRLTAHTQPLHPFSTFFKKFHSFSAATTYLHSQHIRSSNPSSFPLPPSHLQPPTVIFDFFNPFFLLF